MVKWGRPLSDADRDRIEAAMTEAQKGSRARFSLVMVPMSDRYAPYPPLWGAIGALLITGIVALLRPELSIRVGYVISGAGFVLLTLLFDLIPFRLLIVPRRMKHRLAQQLAHREFAVQIIGASKERNGVLFFVSLRERYVEVLADRDIHQRVGSQAWEKIVADCLAAARQGRLADGVLNAISDLKTLLETHYPAVP